MQQSEGGRKNRKGSGLVTRATSSDFYFLIFLLSSSKAPLSSFSVDHSHSTWTWFSECGVPHERRMSLTAFVRGGRVWDYSTEKSSAQHAAQSRGKCSADWTWQHLGQNGYFWGLLVCGLHMAKYQIQERAPLPPLGVVGKGGWVWMQILSGAHFIFMKHAPHLGHQNCPRQWHTKYTQNVLFFLLDLRGLPIKQASLQGGDNKHRPSSILDTVLLIKNTRESK